MNKQRIKKLIMMGVSCILLTIAACGYSLVYNEGRLVKQTYLPDYVFNIKDIPMIAAGILIILYVIYLVYSLVKLKAANQMRDKTHTRKMTPYMGLCGCLGFIGFSGFWTYNQFGIIYPFAFFAFFGLFGLYFEGKLSNTLVDELFEENRRKADIKAYKTGFISLFLIIWVIAGGMFSKNLEWCAIFMMIAISIVYAMVLFLSQYYLYSYEKGNNYGN